MQQVKCARSLLTCWPPTVQIFSPATSLVMNPLQGKPFVQRYNQRKREYGMRTLACVINSGEDGLNRLKKLIIPDQKSEQPILYDGSTKEKVGIDVLDWKNLFLFFSRLRIEDQVDSLSLVYKELQKDNTGVIVWIPVEDKQWTECDQKTFEDLRRKMQWYAIKCFLSSDAIKCFLSSEHMKRKWIFERKPIFKGEPIVTVMDRLGHLHAPVALRDIRKKGVEAIPFLAKRKNTPHPYIY